MESLIGQTLGKYTIRRELGRGGMAAVFLAYQEDMDREVAIKVLPREFMYDQTFLERFKREARAIARMTHPRILPVHDYGEDQGWTYIVMAHMGGGSLSDQIRRFPNGMPLADITIITRQIAEAMDYAHNQGVIHRDLKPSNVLLDPAGNVYLADFGIAKVVEATAELTGSGVVGTPAYLAPEMAKPGGLSPLVDIYALGVMLYQMLTGRQPYQADTPIGIMMAHVTQPVPDAREMRPGLTAGIQAVIEQTMAKEPEDRYQSACDVADALEATIIEAAPEDIVAAEEPLPDDFGVTIPGSSTPPEAPAPEVEEAPPAATPFGMHVSETVEAVPPVEPETIPGEAARDDTLEAEAPAAEAPTIPATAKDVGDEVLAPPEVVTPTPPRQRGKSWIWIVAAVGALAVVAVVVLVALGVIGGADEAAASPEELVPAEVIEEEPLPDDEQPPSEADEIAWGHYERAEQFMDEEDWVAAIIELDQAIQINPNIPDFWHLRGVAHWRIGDDEQQAADYHQCIEVDPDYWKCYRNLGYVYLWYYQDFEQTIAFADRATELNPDAYEPFWIRGLALRDMAGDPWAAVEQFTLAIERNPEDAGLYHERCIALNWTGQYDAAISDCVRSLEIDPENHFNHQELGWIYNNLGDIDRAVEHFRIFLANVPYDEAPGGHDDILMWFEERGIEP